MLISALKSGSRAFSGIDRCLFKELITALRFALDREPSGHNPADDVRDLEKLDRIAVLQLKLDFGNRA